MRKHKLLIQGEIGPDFENIVNVNFGLCKVDFCNSQGTVIHRFHSENFSEGSFECNNLGIDPKSLKIINVFLDDRVNVFDGNLRLFQEFRNIRCQEIPACVLRKIIIDVEGCHAEHDNQYYDDDLFYR